MDLCILDFAGTWQVSRQIRDALGADARFEGVAVFAPDEDGLRYVETGVLTLGTGHSMQAERVYLWRQDGAGSIEVLFDDGRPFHRIDLNQSGPRDRHYCDPDIYDVCYDFADWPVWSARWRVTGPRKDYVMQSEFYRTEDPCLTMS